MKFLLSCKKANSNEIVWKQKLGRIYPNFFPQVSLRYDDEYVYTFFEKDIRAFALATGEEKWYIQLNKTLPENCEDCIQIDKHLNFLVLKVSPNLLKGIDLKRGVPIWEKNFPATTSGDFSDLLQENQKTAYVVSDLSSGNAGSQLNGLNTKSGETFVQQSFPFEIYHTVLKEDQLFILNQQQGRYFFEKYQLSNGTKTWSRALPSTVFLDVPRVRQNWFYEGRLAFYIVSQNKSLRTQYILKFDYEQGKSKVLLESGDYELKIVDDDIRNLYVQAWHKSQNTLMELWSVNKINGKINWSYRLGCFLKFFTYTSSPGFLFVQKTR